MKIIMASWLKLLVFAPRNAKRPRLPVTVGGVSMFGALVALTLLLNPSVAEGKGPDWGNWWRDAERHARRQMMEKEPYCGEVLCSIYEDGKFAVCYCNKGRRGPKWVCYQHGIQGGCF